MDPEYLLAKSAGHRMVRYVPTDSLQLSFSAVVTGAETDELTTHGYDSSAILSQMEKLVNTITQCMTKKSSIRAQSTMAVTLTVHSLHSGLMVHQSWHSH